MCCSCTHTHTHAHSVSVHSVFSHTQTHSLSVYISPCSDSCTQMATESFHQSTAICSDSNGTFREIRHRQTDRDVKEREREMGREINCTDKYRKKIYVRQQINLYSLILDERCSILHLEMYLPEVFASNNTPAWFFGGNCFRFVLLGLNINFKMDQDWLRTSELNYLQRSYNVERLQKN